ncbi:MAG: glycosyltransferase family 4 protein, partial [Acidimicrobiia bacterium]
MRVAYDAAPLLNPRAGVGHYAAALLEEMLKTTDLEFNLFAVTRAANGDHIPSNQRVQFVHRRLPARIVVTAWETLGWPSGEVLTGASDVVHGTNFWIPPTKRSHGIVTIHDLTFLFYPELCTPQVQRYRWIVPKVLKRVAAVITPTETVKREVVEHLKFPSDRVFVTLEGVSGHFRGAKPDRQLLTRLGIGSDYLLFSGTQEPRKNLDRLIQAFADLGDANLELVITGPRGWGSIDLPELAHKLGVGDRTIFCGYLSSAELAAVMAGATAYVFPSIYEGFGLPPLEAMAAGIPVVAARAGSMPEILGDAPL